MWWTSEEGMIEVQAESNAAQRIIIYSPLAINMLAKESVITPQIVREREERHRRLMRMIKNYKRTPEETRRLEKIKDNTVLEINIRHLRSEHNRHFRFPKERGSSDEEDCEPQDNPFFSRETKMYDLKAQNQIHTAKRIPLSLESGRRVKSLTQENNEVSSQRLGRFQQARANQLSQKALGKRSMIEQKRVYSTIKLPQLNKRQKIKTEAKGDSFELQKIIGKKLATESNSPHNKQGASQNKQGLRKYFEKSKESSRKRLGSGRKKAS